MGVTDAKKLLFIDDDQDFLEAQEAFFGARGFVVLTAGGTDEALRLLESETPDMIFIDLMMEHFDSGFTLAHRLRREARFQGTPLVMLSGVAAETGKDFSRDKEGLRSWSQLDDFVDKPASAQRLLKIVERRLAAPGRG
ncbi:MAG: response regulator [Acidobacteriota bacterium]|jgi:two-component system response regulator VicR|nr:response regulator [Acidobacteriota bacterium]